MPTNNENIELRSDDVQEIMSLVPHWMIRWGISLIFTLIALLVFLSWFIKYPDVIQGAVTVSTKEPSIKLFAKSTGEIESLHFKNGALVQKGDILATVGNTFSKEAKEYLSEITRKIEQGLKTGNLNVIFEDENLVFGSIQVTYTELKSAVSEYQYFQQNDPTSFEINSTKEQITNHTSLRSVSNEQLATARKEFANAQNKFQTDQQLYVQKVISKVQLYTEEQKLIQAENNVGNYKKSVVQSSIAITDLKKQLNDLVLNQKQKQTEFLRRINTALSSIKNDLEQWGKNYQLEAPINGVLSYLITVNKHQHVDAGAELLAVVPENQDYIGYIDVPKSGYGKLKTGQKVRIKIDKYPYHEFGQLEGTVIDIALLPTKEVYRVKFKLTKGMKSSYGKTFEYSPEMSGTADIITEDVRLMNRIFNKFRKVFD